MPSEPFSIPIIDIVYALTEVNFLFLDSDKAKNYRLVAIEFIELVRRKMSGSPDGSYLDSLSTSNEDVAFDTFSWLITELKIICTMDLKTEHLERLSTLFVEELEAILVSFRERFI